VRGNSALINGFTPSAGESQKPIGLIAGCRELKREKRATKAFHADPFGGFGQRNNLAVQFERIAVCNLAAVPDGRANTLHQIVIAGPFCDADRLKIASKNRRGGFFIGGGT
jgi:hypothetical protein